MQHLELDSATFDGTREQNTLGGGVDLLLCGAFLWLPKRLAGSDFFDRCDASWTPQDQRHPLPKPSWHLHGAPSRTDLIFVGSRRKRWSALRVGVWWQERTRRTIGSSRQWVKIEGSTSGGFVESTVTCSWSCGVREGNGVCGEMEMTCRCRWPGTRGFWGQPGMFPTRKRFT